MYRLDTKQQAIVDRAIEIAEQVVKPNARAADAEGRYPRASMDALGEAGFLGLTVAAEHGGMAQGPRVVCAVLDELAQRCASTAMCFNMHLAAIAAYQAAASPPLDELRAAARGEHVTTLAFSEFASRSHFWALESQERRRRRSSSPQRPQVVRHLRRRSRRLRGVDALERGQRAHRLDALPRARERRRPQRGRNLGRARHARQRQRADDAARRQRCRRAARSPRPARAWRMMLGAVLPIFNVGSAAISVGIAEAATRITQRAPHRQQLRLQRHEALGPAQRAGAHRLDADRDRSRARLPRLDARRAREPRSVDHAPRPGVEGGGGGERAHGHRHRAARLRRHRIHQGASASSAPSATRARRR